MMQPIDLTFFIALFGSLIAGLWDLKTTEIPEEIPALMTGFGLFIWFIYALSIGNMYPLFLSVIVGTMFLSIGWVFYRMGQWGDGDAAIMASIGYLVPFFPSIPLFSFSFFVNIFIVGLFWVVIYGLFAGLRNEKVIKRFIREFKRDWKKILILPVFTFILLSFMFYYVEFFHWMFLISIISIVFFFSIFVKFGKIVEEEAFIRTIPVSELRPGDVLASSKVWEGLTKQDVERLKRKGGKVKIKDGVRFGIVFPIALFLTVFYGNILFFI